MSARIIITDDSNSMRTVIRALLESESSVAVVGEARSGEEAIRLTGELGPDLVIMDDAMPEMTGIEATRQLRQAGATCKVLALSMHAHGSYVRGMLDAGASGYVLKDCAAEELATAIGTVLAGDTYLSPGLPADVLAESGSRGASGSPGS